MMSRHSNRFAYLLRATLCWIFLVNIACNVCAERIAWFSDSNRPNQDGFGEPMDGGFVFELGVFTAGFTPTGGNLDQWLANWHPAQSATYQPASSRFAGLFNVTSNTAPFTAGAEAYILGRRTTDGVKEWFLVRRNNWLWPIPNPINPFPIDWNVAQANQIILGSLNASANPFLMKAHVQMLSYADWQTAQTFDPSESGELDDPDGDGQANLTEFVLDTPPTQANASLPGSLIRQGDQLFFSIPRRGDRSALITVEVSEDLITWHSGPTHLSIVQQTPLALVIRDEFFTPSGPRRFFRYHISAD